MKYWLEEFDHHDIGFIERNSYLPKYDVNNNLCKYKDQENYKDKKTSVINGFLHFHGYVISYLKIYFVYIVLFFPQHTVHTESVHQNQSIYVSVLLKHLTITTKNHIIMNKIQKYGRIAFHDNYKEKQRKKKFSTD